MSDLIINAITIGSAWGAFLIALILAAATQKKGGILASIFAICKLIFALAATAITVYTVLQIVGMETIVSLAATGIITLILGFGLQGSFEDLFAGLTLARVRQLKEGDLLAVSGFVGKIRKNDSRSVVLEDQKGNTKIIFKSEMRDIQILSEEFGKVFTDAAEGSLEGVDAMREEIQRKQAAADAIYDEVQSAKNEIGNVLEESKKANEELNSVLNEAKDLGTKAKEDAEKTVSLVNNAEKVLSDAKGEAEKTLSDAKNEADTQLKNAKEEAEKTVNSAKEEAEKLSSEAAKAAEETKAEAKKALDDAKTEAEKILEEAKEKAEEVRDVAADTVTKTVEEVKETAEEELEEVKEAVVTMAETAEEIKDAAEDTVTEAKEEIAKTASEEQKKAKKKTSRKKKAE